MRYSYATHYVVVLMPLPWNAAACEQSWHSFTIEDLGFATKYLNATMSCREVLLAAFLPLHQPPGQEMVLHEIRVLLVNISCSCSAVHSAKSQSLVKKKVSITPLPLTSTPPVACHFS